VAIQKWEYGSLTIDHLDDRQVVRFVQYKIEGAVERAIEPDEFGRFVAQLGRESWELAGVSSDQPPPPGARYRESWVFKRPLKASR
jgi:hypothetical protein